MYSLLPSILFHCLAAYFGQTVNSLDFHNRMMAVDHTTATNLEVDLLAIQGLNLVIDYFQTWKSMRKDC